MYKKLILLFFISIFLYNCTSVQEKFNETMERFKGDGTPFIPGI